jgi:hypothetical protein
MAGIILTANVDAVQWEQASEWSFDSGNRVSPLFVHHRGESIGIAVQFLCIVSKQPAFPLHEDQFPKRWQRGEGAGSLLLILGSKPDGQGMKFAQVARFRQGDGIDRGEPARQGQSRQAGQRGLLPR